MLESNQIIIRETNLRDLDDILKINSVAFNNEKEPKLVKDLLNDKTAEPRLSLIALKDEKPVGYILFTKVSFESGNKEINASLLAPLAIIPEAQNQGIGGKLINAGLEILAKSGINAVFVLGHPGYYPKYGFKPAGLETFKAPYFIPEKYSGAWMVQFLDGYIINKGISEKLVCAKMLDKPEYWRE